MTSRNKPAFLRTDSDVEYSHAIANLAINQLGFGFPSLDTLDSYKARSQLSPEDQIASLESQRQALRSRHDEQIKNIGTLQTQDYERVGRLLAGSANSLNLPPEELRELPHGEAAVQATRDQMNRLWCTHSQIIARVSASQIRTRQELASKMGVIKKQLQGEKDAQLQRLRLNFPQTPDDFERLHSVDQQDALQVAKYLTAEGPGRSFISAQAKQAGKTWTDEDIAKMLIHFAANLAFQQKLRDFVKSKTSIDPRKQRKDTL